MSFNGVALQLHGRRRERPQLVRRRPAGARSVRDPESPRIPRWTPT